MTPDEIDDLPHMADRGLPPEAGQRAAERARALLLPELRPVRPLPPWWALALFLIILFAAVTLTAGRAAGLDGFRALSQGQRALIFPALLGAGWLAAVACAREMRPAAGLRLGWLALLLCAGLFPVLFALILNNFSTQDFVAEGLSCLAAGLRVSIPAGAVIVLLLRRGFVLSWSMAGLAAGVLAGLSGLGMLELHCPNLKAPHVMVWHVAVIVVSGLLGFVIGWSADALRRR
jgi:hypothetical protein